jgi:hypothetical protein
MAMHFLKTLFIKPARILATALGLVLYWVFSQTAGNLIADFVSDKLYSFTGYKESDAMKILSDHILSICITAVIAISLFLLGRYDRVDSNRKVLPILNEIFNRTKRLSDTVVTTIEEYEAWKISINENSKFIQRELDGKISAAEINILISGVGGILLNLGGSGFGLEQKKLHNYLHYLEGRVADMIGRYS